MYTLDSFERAMYALQMCRKIVRSHCYVTNEYGKWMVVVTINEG